MEEKRELVVLYIQPGRYPECRVIEDTVPALQAAVGGTFQVVYPWREEVALVCHDEGKLLGLPLNRPLENYDILAGNFFLCGLEGEGFCSLTADQMDRYEDKFHDPMLFFRTGKGIACRPCTPEEYDRAHSSRARG